MSKKELKAVASMVRDNPYYEPSPFYINALINSLDTPDVNFFAAGRVIGRYNFNLSHTDINKLMWLEAYTPLGFILLVYRPEYNKSIEYLLNKGATLCDDDILILIAIADKIDKDLLTLLIASHQNELETPILRNGKNLFRFLALQPYVSPMLVKFLLDKKLDPSEQYGGQVSGIQFAIKSHNYWLLSYYYQHTALKDQITLSENLFLSAETLSLQPSNILFQEPTVAEFTDEVKQFKTSYAIKSLSKWLSEKGKHTVVQNHALFLNDGIISTFLSRKQVTLEQHKPIYPKYEKSFYKGVKTLLSIPFRNDGSGLSEAHANAEKLRSGAIDDTMFFMQKKLERELPRCDNFIVIFPDDIYRLAEQLELFKKQKGSSRYLYIFSLTAKSNHVLSTLSIIDTQNERALFHIFINSWQNEEYISSIAPFINKQPDTIEGITPENFDASLVVQIYPKDCNCSAYSIELTRSLYCALLSNDELRTTLEDFIESNDRFSQWEQLKVKMHYEMKLRLPMFFSKDGETFLLKNEEEIINWHIQNRFSYGADFLEALAKESKVSIANNCHALLQMKPK